MRLAAVAAPTWRVFQTTTPLATMLRDVAKAAPRRSAVAASLASGISDSALAIAQLEKVTTISEEMAERLERDAQTPARFERMDRAVTRMGAEITRVDFALSKGDMEKAARAANQFRRFTREVLVIINAIVLSMEDDTDIDPASCNRLSAEDQEICDLYDLYPLDGVPDWTGPVPERSA